MYTMYSDSIHYHDPFPTLSRTLPPYNPPENMSSSVFLRTDWILVLPIRSWVVFVMPEGIMQATRRESSSTILSR